MRDTCLYLKLRDLSCPRKKGLVFTTRDSCKTDQTQELDGPKGFRKILRKKIPNFMTERGWY